MAIESEPRIYDPSEMDRFCLSPDSDADRRLWDETRPPGGSSEEHDYSLDAFEFGSTAAEDS